MFALVIAAVGMLVASGVPASNARGAPPPTLSIVSPANNAVIGNGSAVAVVFAVTNFNLTDPGTGTTSPGLPSMRTGIEFTNDYRPVSWAHIDADLALSPDIQIGTSFEIRIDVVDAGILRDRIDGALQRF